MGKSIHAQNTKPMVFWPNTLIHFLSAALKVCMCAGNEQETLPPSQINHNNCVVTSFTAAELLLLSTFCLNVVLKPALEVLNTENSHGSSKSY